MKAPLTSLALLLLVVPSTTQQTQRVHVSTANASIHTDASSESQKIATVTAISYYMGILERKEGWTKVSIEGWIDNSELSYIGEYDPDEPEPEESYKKFIELRNVRVADDLFGRKGLFGEIKNRGSRTVTYVELTVYFLDNVGRPIYENTYRPVNVSANSYGDAGKLLKPNYSRAFGYSADRIDGIPSDWSGRVRAEVTEVRFPD
ncbi:hypothetical protein ACFL3X_01935 [Gemmatimonadota bacterium]